MSGPRADPPAGESPAWGLGALRFLYVGTDDIEGSLALFLGPLGGRLRWRFRHFGADVAGIAVGEGPLVLLADHRPPGSVLPIWAVADLSGAVESLRSGGWSVVGPLGTPEGDAVVLTDPGGAELALLEVVRPGALDGAWADEANTHRVRPGS